MPDSNFCGAAGLPDFAPQQISGSAMSDELKREQARVARRVIENFIALRVPSFTEAPMRGSEEQYIDRVIYEAIDAAVRAAVKERGEDAKLLDAYRAWADKATTQLCGDEPLDRSQLIKEWEAIEPENAEDNSLQQQPEVKS